MADANKKPVSASGTVEIRIVNESDITVYDKTRQFTKSNFETWTYDDTNEMYVAAIYIEPKDILAGSTAYGTLHFTVSGDNYGFEETSLSVFDLPIDPKQQYTPQNTCLNTYCDNEVAKSGDYCSEHKCENGNCGYEKEPNSQYCYFCLCGTSGCLNLQINNGSYCVEHTCENGDCGYEKELNADYCSICLCGTTGCLNVKGYYCVNHTCSKPGCQFNKSVDEKYCSYHACDVCGELRGSGLYCPEHE